MDDEKRDFSYTNADVYTRTERVILWVRKHDRQILMGATTALMLRNRSLRRKNLRLTGQVSEARHWLAEADRLLSETATLIHSRPLFDRYFGPKQN